MSAPPLVQDTTDATTRLHLDTRFGRFDVDARDVVTFPSGLPGFEQCRHFVLLSSPDLDPMSCLQAIDGAPASFLVVNPRRVLPGYRSVLTRADLVRLGAEEDSVLLWLAIVSIGADERAFVNLRAPVVINPERMLGYQVMPHNSLYPLRHPLAAE